MLNKWTGKGNGTTAYCCEVLVHFGYIPYLKCVVVCMTVFLHTHTHAECFNCVVDTFCFPEYAVNIPWSVQASFIRQLYMVNLQGVFAIFGHANSNACATRVTVVAVDLCTWLSLHWLNQKNNSRDFPWLKYSKEKFPKGKRKSLQFSSVWLELWKELLLLLARYGVDLLTRSKCVFSMTLRIHYAVLKPTCLIFWRG